MKRISDRWATWWTTSTVRRALAWSLRPSCVHSCLPAISLSLIELVPLFFKVSLKIINFRIILVSRSNLLDFMLHHSWKPFTLWHLHLPERITKLIWSDSLRFLIIVILQSTLACRWRAALVLIVSNSTLELFHLDFEYFDIVSISKLLRLRFHFLSRRGLSEWGNDWGVLFGRLDPFWRWRLHIFKVKGLLIRSWRHICFIGYRRNLFRYLFRRLHLWFRRSAILFLNLYCWWSFKV